MQPRKMQPRSAARLIYESLLGTPSDELSAYVFADVMRAYADAQPAPFSKFFACKLLHHCDKKPVAAFTLKDVQLHKDPELDILEELKGDRRAELLNQSSRSCLPFMPCFDAFVGEGGLLMAFKDLLKFGDNAVWNDEQLLRFGKLCRPSLWRSLEEYGIPLQGIAEIVIEASRWWRNELGAVEPRYANRKEHRGSYRQGPNYEGCRGAPSVAYTDLLRKQKLRLLLVFEELNTGLDDALDAHTRDMSAPTRSFGDSLDALERHLREIDETNSPSDPHPNPVRQRRKKELARIARRLHSVRCIQSKRHKAKSRKLCREERSKPASTGRPREGAEIAETPARVPSTGSFPDLEVERTPVPYIRLSEPGADFSNSKNECAQLSAWIETMDRESTVALLRRLSTYRSGSLYQFMLVWCQAAEGFDPLTGKESGIDYNFPNFLNPNDEGRLMWNYIETRSATLDMNLQRILHLLLYLYSNDRLTTRQSSTSPTTGEPTGRPGELVRKMTCYLRSRSGLCIEPSRLREYKSEAHRRAVERWKDEACDRFNFESLAPGWVDYMVGCLGSLKRALKFPPFDDAFPPLSLEIPSLQQ